MPNWSCKFLEWNILANHFKPCCLRKSDKKNREDQKYQYFPDFLGEQHCVRFAISRIGWLKQHSNGAETCPGPAAWSSTAVGAKPYQGSAGWSSTEVWRSYVKDQLYEAALWWGAEPCQGSAEKSSTDMGRSHITVCRQAGNRMEIIAVDYISFPP